MTRDDRPPAIGAGVGALAALAAAGLALGACGGEDDGTGVRTTTAPDSGRATQLGAAERRRLDAAERRIEAYCARFAAFRLRGSDPPPPTALRRAERAVDELLEIARAHPEARIGISSDVRAAVGDAAESVEGANCDPRIESRLDAGIATLP